MKAKKIHYVPFYGSYRYFKEYFKLEKTSFTDATAAAKMQMYHIIMQSIIFMLILKAFMMLTGYQL